MQKSGQVTEHHLFMIDEKVSPVTTQAQVGGPGRAATQEGGKESDLKIRIAASEVAVNKGERRGMASVQFGFERVLLLTAMEGRGGG